MIQKTSKRTFDVTGKVKWVKEPRKVLCGAMKKERDLRNVLLGYDRTSIEIAEWG